MLKKFNNFITESYKNETINIDEFNRLSENALEFDEEEFHKINTLIQKYFIDVTLNRVMFNRLSIYSEFIHTLALIVKIPDDWYLIQYVNHNYNVKCDSFEGLLIELKRWLD